MRERGLRGEAIKKQQPVLSSLTLASPLFIFFSISISISMRFFFITLWLLTDYCLRAYLFPGHLLALHRRISLLSAVEENQVHLHPCKEIPLTNAKNLIALPECCKWITESKQLFPSHYLTNHNVQQFDHHQTVMDTVCVR